MTHSAASLAASISKAVVSKAVVRGSAIALTLTLGWSAVPTAVLAQNSLAANSASPLLALPSDYILGPGDELAITVLGFDEYTGTRVIAPNGTITLPVVGVVPVAGQTIDSLTRDLTTRLNYYLVNPSVAVSLTSLRPVFVTVTGEVQRPGPIQLDNPRNGNSGNNPQQSLPTLSSALVAAGGITTHADLRQVLVRRSLPSGGTTTLTVNLWDGIWAEADANNPLLQDGDVVLVPQLAADATLDRRQIARSSLAPATVRVRVVGEVTRPGEVLVPPNSSLSSAVAIAGGPTEDARLSQVNFIRMNDQGQIERQEIDLRNLTDSYQVQEGDVIVVPKQTAASVADFAGRIFNPLGVLLRVFGL
ncbi:MAG: polysaccharide biosynthesis/export family protein [Elainellaceae cyanobacterium]